ncbi:uncharacterized protein LOC133526235 [Cydia pomonella]|uniref:uncharacterized protein LOC133526235 n=1 Tax=Cydia pomonella TaxID=82600 RepID=UPI002ADD8FB4|nr:uncharacterized protein LOC133526235 [Cydia pomonella]
MDTEEPSELMKLLAHKDNVPLALNRKCDSTTPKVISYSVEVQCEVPTADKSTNYNSHKLKTSQSTQTVTFEKPSLCSATSQLGSVDSLTENNLQQHFINLICNSPKQYLGIPKQFQWVLKHICEHNRNKLSKLTLIITLYKIKQNGSLIKISDQFDIPSSEINNMFVKGIECLANFFQNLIFLPAPDQIEAQLPHKFKVRYPNVQCILHSLEIEIKTLTDPLRQAQTWSEDKYGHTLKYLIGCTPNGFVAFVSKGYGGGVSDKDILEGSNLIDILPRNTVVMAEWQKKSFVGVESHLMTKGVRLLRPNHPGINSSTQPAQEEAIKILRVHLERMTKRLRQFEMLSEVNSKHIGYMDQILIIACGLVNLQTTPQTISN